MCGRYSNTASAADIAQRFSLGGVPAEGARRFNIAPTEDALVALGDRESGALRPRMMSWGLVPGGAKDRRVAAKMINARSETVASRPAFRKLVGHAHSRCLVLADGYYEWLKAEDARQPKVPMFFSLADRRPFAFAGLWTSWRSPEDERLETFTILTTAANELARPIHHRMPVLLSEPEQWLTWLDPDLDARVRDGLLAPPASELLEVRAVNPAVNSVHHKEPDSLDDAPTADQQRLALD